MAISNATTPPHARVRFILIGTTHAGNIGATARAIKTMGFGELHLVEPQAKVNQDAVARASGANDILEHLQIHDSLDDAVADCHEVIGTSARDRRLSVPIEPCRPLLSEVAARLGPPGNTRQVALLFGRERYGLLNQEIDRCTHLLTIPANPAFASLNLGSAVQLVAWELSQALAQRGFPPGGADGVQASADPSPEDTVLPVESQAMQAFFAHLEQSMIASGFLDPDEPKHLMRRLRGYFERNRPDARELNILRGVLAAKDGKHRSGCG